MATVLRELEKPQEQAGPPVPAPRRTGRRVLLGIAALYLAGGIYLVPPDRQKEEILSTAYREAEKIKGDGDAQSTRIYGAAYSRDPQFYKLVRTLEAYKKILDDKTTAVLSSDSELLRLLTKGRGASK